MPKIKFRSQGLQLSRFELSNYSTILPLLLEFKIIDYVTWLIKPRLFMLFLLQYYHCIPAITLAIPIHRLAVYFPLPHFPLVKPVVSFASVEICYLQLNLLPCLFICFLHTSVIEVIWNLLFSLRFK